MRKNRKPNFDFLEDRKLMTAGFRPDTANSSRISAIAPETMMVGYPPMTPPPPTTPPSISITGGSPNSIGGSVGVSVTPGYGNVYKMTKIVYTTDKAIATQTFGVPYGDFATFSTNTHEYTTGVASDMQNFFWNEEVGGRTVTVAVTYDDPGHTTLTNSVGVYVAKPTVIGTTLKGKTPRFGQLNGGTDTRYGIAYRGTDGTPGFTIQSTIGNRPSPGEFGFVQLITSNTASMENETAVKTWPQLPAGTTLLDQPIGGSSDPEMDGSWNPVGAGSSSISLAPRVDSPALFVDLATYNAASVPTTFSASTTFDTHLVFKPSGGLYVAIDHINWTITATATYKGPEARPEAAYKDPANWTVVYTPVDAIDKVGDFGVKLLKWQGNTTDNSPTPITVLK